LGDVRALYFTIGFAFMAFAWLMSVVMMIVEAISEKWKGHAE
jgi:hypothetical protein